MKINNPMSLFEQDNAYRQWIFIMKLLPILSWYAEYSGIFFTFCLNEREDSLKKFHRNRSRYRIGNIKLAKAALLQFMLLKKYIR